MSKRAGPWRRARRTHPGPVGLALVAESEDHDDGEDGQHDGEQDAHVVVLLWARREGTRGNVRNHGTISGEFNLTV